MTRKGKKESTNGAVDVLSTIIKHVMSSASEAETGALYYGCKRAIPYRVTNTRRDGPSPRKDTSNDQQQHRPWPHNGNHELKSLQIKRHAFSMAQMPQSTTHIQIPLGTRSLQQSRLSKQTPPSITPSAGAPFSGGRQSFTSMIEPIIEQQCICTYNR